MIIFITGGARSGKSGYAQQLALSLSANPVYVATAKIWDDDFEQRVKRHQHDRDSRWVNLEEQRNVSSLPIKDKTTVIDCVTLWLTNFFVGSKNDVKHLLRCLKWRSMHCTNCPAHSSSSATKLVWAYMPKQP